jgi:DNA replication and repair protein RecF
MITDLRMQQFRSYKDASFEFGAGVNIIVGPNGSGKTNMLEALLVLARGKSYRAKDQELILFDKPWTRLDSHDQDNEHRTVKITIEPNPEKTYEIDGKKLKRLNLDHNLPVVLFEPNHLQLFGGGSERRRDYLDDLLEQTTPGYSTTRRQYRRALAQRNTLLKHRPSKSQLFPWDVRLSQLAGVIVRARSDLTGKINEDLPKLYKELSKSKAEVSVAYQNRWPVDNYESSFLHKLESSLDEDMLRGFTGTGPHREDLSLFFGSHPVQQVASRGEVRTAVLALKIIELTIIESVREKTPLLLLDDVFSELDGKRRHALTDRLSPYQTFVTTTDADTVLGHFTKQCTVIALTDA